MIVRAFLAVFAVLYVHVYLRVFICVLLFLSLNQNTKDILRKQG